MFYHYSIFLSDDWSNLSFEILIESEDTVLWFWLCRFCQCYEMSHVAGRGAKKQIGFRTTANRLIFYYFSLPQHIAMVTVILEEILYSKNAIPTFHSWHLKATQRLKGQIWDDWLVVLMIAIKLRPEENRAICEEERLMNV